MIAALTMYARPETRAGHDAFWALVRDRLRARGVDAPDALDWQIGHMEVWARPDLVLAQICNLPYRAEFRGRVTLIGAGDYGLTDCAPGQYHSVFVVRADDPAQSPHDCARAGYRLAYNEGLSQSGWGSIYDWAATHDLPLNPTLQTGAHAASMAAVAEGRADWASLDAVTWGNLCRFDPRAAGLRVIGRSDPSPGLTFCTRAGQDPAPYLAALQDAVAAQDPATAAATGLRAVVTLPADSYDLPLPQPPKAAAHPPG